MRKFRFLILGSFLFFLSFSVQSETLLFLSDLEGNVGKWNTFIRTSGCFQGSSPPINVKQNGYQNVQTLLKSRSLRLQSGCKFFYLGDVMDKGDGSIRILRDLVYLKLSNSGNIFLMPGNREINKLRFLQEISPAGEINFNNFYRFTQLKVSASPGIKTKELNDQYFGKSLGAPSAMDFRSREIGLDNLKNSNYDEWSKKVLASLREDVDNFNDSPGGGPSKGLLLKYLQLSQILTRYNDIILSHGFIGADNLGLIPNIGSRSEYGLSFDKMPIKTSADFHKWSGKLNDFLKSMLTKLTTKKYSDKVDDNTRLLGEELILYQEPTLKIRPGRTNDFNQESVVLGRNSNSSDFGNAFDLSVGEEAAVTETLNAIGIKLRMGGHTPVGQTPLIQKINNKKRPGDPPRWSINIDNSAEHSKMPRVTSVFKQINNKDFYINSSVVVTGPLKKMEVTFKKDGKDNSRIGERVKCQNSIFTVVGEFQKGNYLLYRSEDKYKTNNIENNLADCPTI